MNKIKLCLNYAGYCTAKEGHAIRGGGNYPIRFHALWGLIQHPGKGWILYDTGYTRRFYAETRAFPNNIYALLTKVFVNTEDEVKFQLEKVGIQADDVQHIIITHFHADHIGGLKDFPNARFYVSKAAVNKALKSNGLKAVTGGILKGLIPSDFKDRINLIEEISTPVLNHEFGMMYDLFHDQSVFVVPLPGHAAGQIGILLETEKHSYFLISDSCWLSESYEKNLLPNSVSRLIFDSWTDFKSTLRKIHKFYIDHPETIIVPTHCIKSTSKLVSGKIDLNEL